MVNLANKEIFLHLGAHKTASTALQRYLSGAASARDDVAYFGPQDLRSGESSLSPLVQLGKLRVRGWEIQTLVAELLARFSVLPSRRVFISDENILGPMPGTSKGLYPTASHVARLVSELRRNGARVRGLLFVREQASLLQSVYLYRIAHGLKSAPEAFLDRLRLDRLAWLRPVAQLSEAFAGELEVIPYAAIRNDFQELRSALAAQHSLFEGFEKLELVNVSPRSLSLYVVQQLRLYGVPIGGQAVASLCRKLDRAVERVGEDVENRERVLIRRLQAAQAPTQEGWQFVVRHALRVVAERALEGGDPLRFSESTLRLIRGHCRADNQRLLDELVDPRWHPCWEHVVRDDGMSE